MCDLFRLAALAISLAICSVRSLSSAGAEQNRNECNDIPRFLLPVEAGITNNVNRHGEHQDHDQYRGTQIEIHLKTSGFLFESVASLC